MAPEPSRPRSSTAASTASTRPRPISRASTTSVNTTSEHPTQEVQHGFPKIYPQPSSSFQSDPKPFTPEESISRLEDQLKNPHRPFTFDPSLHAYQAHSRAMSVDTAYSGNNDISRPQLAHSYSHDGQANHVFSSVNEDKPPFDDSKADAQKRSKGSATSQANDQELRRLFSENRHRDLRDVAASVLANERGPKSEKTKQIFAMNWLSTVCKRSKSSVPRYRVYAQYAQRCGTERVPVLNPASFGKLVRIIFPDITTRRLGMRGLSKYHYVDLTLETDEPEEPHSGCNSFPHTQTDTANFPSPDLPFQISVPKPKLPPKIESNGHLFLDHTAPDLHRGQSREKMISRQLRFPDSTKETFPDDAPIELPDLQPYLPPVTDVDTAAALKALYRSHCVSTIDCIRFCKEKLFWHQFTSFHGTLTVPVQKLFAHPNIALWISECDWLMYQKVIQFVSPLALQVMPELVTNAFQSIADNLGRQILSIFSGHPQHVRDAKHGPAVIFSGLLNRLLRVNAASHAAAHILGNDATREQMWHDWVHHVKPTVVAESCLPGVGYSRCIQILTNELRDLLSPLAMTSYPHMQQIYRTTATEPVANHSSFNELDDTSTSSVLDRWVTFLHDLPSRFPNADARTLLHCVSDVGTAALRDITMATAVSFGQWTVTKVWVDEMMQWLAEKGGLLENSPKSAEMRPKKRSADEAGLENGVPSWDPKRRTSMTESVNLENLNGHIKQTNHAFGMVQNDGTSFQGLPSTYRVATHNPMANALYVRPPPDYPQAAPQISPARPGFHSSNAQHHSTPPSQRGGSKDQRSRPSSSGSGLRQEQTKANISSHEMHLTKDIPYDDSNDDSGIGLDLDFRRQQSPLRVSDYGGFVTSMNSDPADVVVC